MKRYDYYCQELNFFNKLFESSKKENKIIQINNEFGTEIRIDIELYEIIATVCGQCKNRYNDIFISGNFYENDEINPYYGTIKSRYIMCKSNPALQPELGLALMGKCDILDKEWNDFEYDQYLLFDLTIDRKNNYLVQNFFSSKDDVKLVDKN